MFHVFEWYIRYNLEYLKQNKNHLKIKIHHFMLELLFLVYCFYNVFLYFSTRNNRKFWTETCLFELLNSNHFDIFYVVYSLCCFPCSWISFPNLDFNNILSISFFILFSDKDPLHFTVNWISCFKFSLEVLGQSTWEKEV